MKTVSLCVCACVYDKDQGSEVAHKNIDIRKIFKVI